MAEYIPNNIIYLLQNIPWDDNYSDVMWFSDDIEQQAFFTNNIYKSYTNCSYHRINAQVKGGAPKSAVRVPENAETLYTCNYLMFQNRSFGNKYFFAFIKEINYINPNMAEIVYELDHLQTWMFELEFHPSMILREHYINSSGVEPLFANIQPEPFANVPALQTAQDNFYFDMTHYLVAATESPTGKNDGGSFIAGIYQGFYITECKASPNVSGELPIISDLVNQYNEAGKTNAIVAIQCIPEMPSSTMLIEPGVAQGIWKANTFITSSTTFPYNNTINGYTPKNKKLYQYPYCYYKLSASNGNNIELRPQNFDKGISTQQNLSMQYRICSAIPSSIVMLPIGYGGPSPTIIPKDEVTYDYSVEIPEFPQSTANVDVFAQYLAQNGASIALNTTLGILTTITGAALTVTGVGTLQGLGMMANGAQSLAAQGATLYDESQKPNQITGKINNNWFRTAFDSVGFEIKFFQIQKEDAQKIDEYFNLYGYATNRVKMPNLTGRRFWNYVQTQDICLTGSVPVDSMAIIKNIFNKGVRLWHQNVIGQFDLDNAITGA